MPIRETPNCVDYYYLVCNEWEKIKVDTVELSDADNSSARQFEQSVELEIAIEAPPWLIWYMEYCRQMLVPKISRK